MNSKKITYILVGVIVVAVFVTFVLILRGVGSGTQQVTLTFWGVYDDPSDFTPVINAFRQQYPNINVKYQLFTYDQYEQAVVNGLAAGTGPDIFMIHNTWLPKDGDKLAAMPAKIGNTTMMTVPDFESQFVDVAAQDLVYQNQIYALPLYVDTLALYYNKDLFNAAGITEPPTTWQEVNADTQLLTKFDTHGNITQAGAALGTSQNINRPTDILMDMMLQSGVQMTSSDNTNATFAEPVQGQNVGQTDLQYYTDFANPRSLDYSWNSSQHYSVNAFTEGTLGMMFDYSHEGATIQSEAPRLNFGIAPMPQASLTTPVNFANYWAVGVAKNSAHVNEAWEFINYLASRDGAAAYLNVAQRPAARRDLIDLQKTDPNLGVFALQALTAKSWFQADNDAIETIFSNMIDDVNFNRATVADALSKAESQVTVLMQK